MFSTLPPQGEGKISCPWKLDFLARRQDEIHLANENGGDHVNLPRRKHIDRSRILEYTTIDMRLNELSL